MGRGRGRVGWDWVAGGGKGGGGSGGLTLKGLHGGPKRGGSPIPPARGMRQLWQRP